MNRAFYCLSLGIGALLLATHYAQADQRANCAPRAVVVERLHSAFGERRQLTGLSTTNTLIEVFASDTTGSWTLTVTTPNGVTCLVATGIAFENMNHTPQDDGA